MALLVIGLCSSSAGAAGLRVLLPRLGYDTPLLRPTRLRFVAGMWTLIVCGAIAVTGGVARLALA